MRQRLQIARNLVTDPRLVFMDEPTGGLDVSVQARLLDLLRGLVRDLGLAAIVVTHDLAVARLLSHRMIVMKDGRVVEHGLTDRCSTIRARPTPSFWSPRSCRSDDAHAPRLSDVSKTFTMHLQGGIRLPVVENVTFSRCRRRMRGAGRAVGRRQELDPEDDLRQLRRRWRADHRYPWRAAGRHRHRRSRARCSKCAATRSAMSASSCAPFPRVPALDVVAEPLVARGVDPEAARERAAMLLKRLNLPDRLWQLPPATFSGGEQQRVNVARGFITDHPVLLLDEPTASLDAANRKVVASS
jgi:alpha-D-ribose 1-methylphosphonate 5-triphosphate synthase subunit PhnL